jgi:hypothetical protein
MSWIWILLVVSVWVGLGSEHLPGVQHFGGKWKTGHAWRWQELCINVELRTTKSIVS